MFGTDARTSSFIVVIWNPSPTFSTIHDASVATRAVEFHSSRVTHSTPCCSMTPLPRRVTLPDSRHHLLQTGTRSCTIPPRCGFRPCKRPSRLSVRLPILRWLFSSASVTPVVAKTFALWLTVLKMVHADADEDRQHARRARVSCHRIVHNGALKE